jgi:carbon-monoxide dehydrogenase medium subunit
MMNDRQATSVNPPGGWSIEADAPLQAVLDRTDTPPLLRRTLTGALSWQIRNETSVGRALKATRTAPQWLAALLALGATVTIDGEGGPTQIPLEALLQREAEGKVSGLHVPPGGPGQRWGKAHVARTPADIPIVAAVAVVELADNIVHQARVALTGAWPETARLAEAPAQLVGAALDETAIEAVAAAVEQEAAPRDDFLGSQEYRRAMAGVLTRRALEACRRQEVGRE